MIKALFIVFGGVLLILVIIRSLRPRIETGPERWAERTLVGGKPSLEEYRKLANSLNEVFQTLEAAIQPGVTTRELEVVVEEELALRGLQSSFKGYGGFPANITVAIDSELMNGLPSDRQMQPGQIVSLQVGLMNEHAFAYQSWSYSVGKLDNHGQNLLTIARSSLDAGVSRAVEGARVSDISFAIQSEAEAAGFSVSRDFVGHGMGAKMHQDPQILCFAPNGPGKGSVLQAGDILSIQSILHEGHYETVILDDTWTSVSSDGLRSAQFSQMVIVQPSDPEVLTRGLN